MLNHSRLAILISICAMWLAVDASAAIPLAERDALIDLYNSTNGPGWTNKTNWLGAPGTECTWYGVGCDGGETTVTSLGLYSNQLSGTIPASIGNLTSLTSLSFDNNQLTGSIPTTIGNLTNLVHLMAGVNQLTGPIPHEIGNLTNLQGLWLYSNQLSGPLPDELWTLTNLERFSIHDSVFGGSLPPELGNLTKLREIRMWGCGLTGPIPAEIGNLTYLEDISLNNNNLTGSIPAEIGSLTSLTQIVLHNNQLTGSIPPELGNLANLDRLLLNQNQLSGPIPASLGNLPNMLYIDFGGNQLSGTIPPEFGALTNLIELYLYGNQLTGGIPAELGSLSNLTHLYLSGNQLGGTIPLGLGNLTNLQYLHLSYNHLSGTIPPELGNLAGLRELSLQWNQLSGTIPPEIGSLTSLQTLELDSNQLVGAIPSNIQGLGSVSTLHIHFNGLYTNDPSTRSWLDARQPGWDSTQTVAPGNFAVSSAGLTTMSLTWTPIPYTWDAGRYVVSFQTGTEPVMTASTSDKSASGLTLTGLIPGTTYTLWMSTTTDPHGGNQNTVTSSSTGTIFGTTSLSAITIEDVSVAELNSGTGPVAVTFALAPASPSTVTVQYTTVSGTALAGSDFAAASGTVTFNPGETSATIEVLIIGDSVAEPDEHFTVVLSNPSGAALGSDTARVTILDNDSASRPATVVVTANPPVMFQEAGAGAAGSSFVVANLGDSSTSVTLAPQGGFYSIQRSQFTLGPRASETVTISASATEIGTFAGSIMLSGAGVPPDLSVPVSLIVYGPPGAAVPDVAPLHVRIDVTGSGQEIPGSCSFRNDGSVAATGVVVADAPWLVPAVTTPQTIQPGQTLTIDFTVDRVLRPDPSSIDSLFTTVRFVYPPRSTASARDSHGSGTGSQPGSTVADTPSLAGAPGGLPEIAAGQVGLTLPLARCLPIPNGRIVTDLVLSSTTIEPALSMYMLESRELSAAALKAGQSIRVPSFTPLRFGDVIGCGFECPNREGSVHLRSAVSSVMTVEAMTFTIDNLRQLLAFRDTPTARSDRGAAPGAALYLTGIGLFDLPPASVVVEEVEGNATSFEIDILDMSGSVLQTIPRAAIEKFQLLNQPLPALAATSTIVVRNTGSAGRITALAEESWVTLDAGAVWDSTSVFGGSRTDALILPWVSSSRADSSRRRPVRPGTGTGKSESGTSGVTDSTSFALFSATGAHVELEFRNASRSITTTVDLARGQTKSWRNCLAELFGITGADEGSILIRPTIGELTAAAWVTARNGTTETSVTSVPAIPAGNSIGINTERRFYSVADFSTVSLNSGVAAAVTPTLGLVETTGSAATVEVSVGYGIDRATAGVSQKKTFSLSASQTLLVDDVVRNVVGTARENAPDLYSVTIAVKVTAGSGRVLPFVLSTAASSGDRMIRVR